MPQARVLIISGSTAPESAASRLAAAFMRELAFLDAAVTLVSLADYAMPVYDPDTATEPPIAARKLAGFIEVNHAVFVSSGSASGTPAPVVANTLHWIAHVRRSEVKLPTKPIFILGTAGASALDGAGALSHLRDLVAAGFGAPVFGGLTIDGDETFDDKGRLDEPKRAMALQMLARDVVFAARRLAAEA